MIPVFDPETILHACLYLTETERECMTLDVSGHYSRPDLFRFSVAEEKRGHPMDVAHPLGDFSFRRVPSDARQSDLIIHQLKYPHDDADVDIDVTFPIERLQDLAAEGVIGGLTRTLFSFIGYNMDPERLEATVAEGIARAVDEEERADVALLAPA